MHLPRPLWVAITVLIVLLWAATITVGLIYPDRARPELNVIFGGIIASLYLDVPTIRKKIGKAITGKDRPQGGEES